MTLKESHYRINVHLAGHGAQGFVIQSLRDLGPLLIWLQPLPGTGQSLKIYTFYEDIRAIRMSP